MQHKGYLSAICEWQTKIKIPEIIKNLWWWAAIPVMCLAQNFHKCVNSPAIGGSPDTTWPLLNPEGHCKLLPGHCQLYPHIPRGDPPKGSTPIQGKHLMLKTFVPYLQTMNSSFVFNHYYTNALNPFKSASYERTLPGTLMLRLRIIAPLVISTLHNGLWSDSRSGHFTQLCTPWVAVSSLPVIFKTSYVCSYAKQLTPFISFWWIVLRSSFVPVLCQHIPMQSLIHSAKCCSYRKSNYDGMLHRRIFLLCTPQQRTMSFSDSYILLFMIQ